MKKQLIIITLGLSTLFAATTVAAKSDDSFTDKAKVLHTEPIHETVAPPSLVPANGAIAGCTSAQPRNNPNLNKPHT